MFRTGLALGFSALAVLTFTLAFGASPLTASDDYYAEKCEGECPGGLSDCLPMSSACQSNSVKKNCVCVDSNGEKQCECGVD